MWRFINSKDDGKDYWINLDQVVRITCNEEKEPIIYFSDGTSLEVYDEDYDDFLKASRILGFY